MRSILDTSILIAGNTERIDGELAISVVSVAEMEYGVLVAPDETLRAHRLARLSAVLGAFEPLPVDAAVSSSYAQLAAATTRAGRQPRTRSMDLLIAATAHAHHARLVTANIDDVEHLQDLLEIVSG